MKQYEDLINEVRTVQKSLRRLSGKLVEAGVFPPGGEDARFLICVNEYMYSIVNSLVDEYYLQGQVPGTERTDPPVGGSEGGLVEWIIDRLRP